MNGLFSKQQQLHVAGLLRHILFLAVMIVGTVVYCVVGQKHDTLVAAVAAGWSFTVLVCFVLGHVASFAAVGQREDELLSQFKWPWKRLSYGFMIAKWLIIGLGFYVLWKTDYKNTHIYSLLIGVFLGYGVFVLACVISQKPAKQEDPAAKP